MADGPQSESAKDHFTTSITLSKDQEEGAGLAVSISGDTMTKGTFQTRCLKIIKRSQDVC